MVNDLMAMSAVEKAGDTKDRCRRLQTDVLGPAEKNAQLAMRPRTLEEAIAYENFALLRAGTISIGIQIPEALPDAYQAIYDRVRSDNFKKTDFANESACLQRELDCTAYIAEGLRWLETRLCGCPDAGAAGATETTGEASRMTEKIETDGADVRFAHAWTSIKVLRLSPVPAQERPARS